MNKNQINSLKIPNNSRYYISVEVILLIIIGSILPAFAQDDYYTLESQAAQMYQQGNYFIHHVYWISIS